MTPGAPVALTLQPGGLHLIEASAGTGKTWTLSVLFIRLVLETDLDARELLVATFTRAAAADLKTRFRERLERTLLLLKQSVSDQRPEDPFDAWLLAQAQQNPAFRTAALDRLNLVAATFDEILITTLDGVAQRLLNEFAVECGVMTATELVPDDRPMLEALIHSAIRLEEAGNTPEQALLFYSGIRPQPDKILSLVREVQARPNARLQSLPPVPEGFFADIGHLVQTLDTDATVWMDIPATHLHKSKKLAKNLARLPALWQTLQDWHHQLQTAATGITQLAITWGQLAAITQDFGSLLEGLNQFSEQFVKAGQATLEQCLANPRVIAWQALSSQLLQLDEYLKLLAAHQTCRVVSHVLEHWSRWLQESGKTTFGLQTLTLSQALQHPSSGTALARLMHQRFPYALIDEFQDTNQAQADILLGIYAPANLASAVSRQSSLVLVGDPKQAIYGFRGGDIHAYLATRQLVCQQEKLLHKPLLHSLQFNQRSVAGLVRATDQLLASSRDMGDGISYPDTFASGRTDPVLYDGSGSATPPVCWLVPDPVQGVADMTQQATLLARSLADQIEQQQLRICQPDGTSQILRLSDIAILCNTNTEVAALRAELTGRGLTVQSTREQSVFASEMAPAMLAILQLWQQPHLLSRLRMLMLSPLFNMALPALNACCSDSLWLNRHQGLFSECYSLLQQQGFLVAWQHFCTRTELWQNVTAHPRRHRHTIDLKHLVDLLQKQLHPAGNLEEGILWLTGQLQDQLITDETRQHPEADTDGLWLMTIHGSKGLEFPIVILPFHAKSRRSHLLAPVLYQKGHYEYLLLPSSRQQHTPLLAESERAENLRKTYVALTRARYRTYILQPQDKPDNIFAHWLPEGVHHFVQRYPGSHGLVVPLQEQSAGAAVQPGATSTPATLVCPPLALSSINNSWRSTSFSRMIAGHDLPEALALFGQQNSRPGAEDISDQLQHQSLAQNLLPADSLVDDIRYRFPGGTQSGNLLHLLLQYVDAKAPDQWQQDRFLAQAVSSLPGMTEEPAALTGWLEELVQTPLPGGHSLAQTGYGRQIRELDFQLFLKPGHIAEQQLRDRLAREGIYLAPLQQTRWVRFLNGAIDLVYESDGRYYVADYKSNFLGKHPDCYHPDALRQNMDEAGYWLQATLYLVVLHRHLASRLPEYNIHRHLGGACYLYLRGMFPDRPGHGILHWQPDPALILDIDQLLESGACSTT